MRILSLPQRRRPGGIQTRLFCFCPLYCLGENCGGNFCYTEDGLKDCSGCLRPHRRENYEAICMAMSDVLELAKKRDEQI